MKHYYFIGCAICLLLSLSMDVVCQTLDWNVQSSKPETFISQHPADDPDVTLNQTWHINMKDIYDFHQDHEGILIDNLGAKGYAKLSVYLYNDTVATGEGPLIYQCTANTPSKDGNDFVHSSINYLYDNWLGWWPNDDENTFSYHDYWNSTDQKASAVGAVRNNYMKYFTVPPAIPGAFPGNILLPGMPYSDDNKIPVVIELEVYKANVRAIEVPGIGEILPSYFNPPYLSINTSKVNFSSGSFTCDLIFDRPGPIDEGLRQPVITDITVTLEDPAEHVLNQMNVRAEQILTGPPQTTIYVSLPHGSVPGTKVRLYANYGISFYDRHGNLHTYPKQKQFLFNYHEFGPGDIDVYNVAKVDYKGLPVFKLKGGMSAEYTVEKSIADLAGGVSETWDVRTVNGKPDLKGGGPISVYPDNQFDFVKKSVKETVDVYNTNLGKNTPFGTVIISTGPACIPYVSNAFKAPVLPLHFLVSINSIKEVGLILDSAKASGYSVYATCGYDPSMSEVGVAWIKLRTLPPEYRQFLIDHQVKRVIIMGYLDGDDDGETHARRVQLANQSEDDYSDGSIYMMAFGEMKTYKSYFKDFNFNYYDKEKTIPDWEGGVSEVQIANFSDAIRKIPNQPPNVYAIQTGNSVNFYRWAFDVQETLLKKTSQQPKEVSLNEYLVGFPVYEQYKSTVPFLYWQGAFPGPDLTAFWVNDFGAFKTRFFFPSVDYKNLKFYIQAKADRTPFLIALKKYFPDVSMGSWQQADVWNPEDGMNSPCELAADDIIGPDGSGLGAFRTWLTKRAILDDGDIDFLLRNSVKPAPLDAKLFPKPGTTETIADFSQAGLKVTQYQYDTNEYWHPKNYPNSVQYRGLNSYPGSVTGFLDGQESPNDIRHQDITIASFDLANTSDEFDLRMAYKFNLNDKDGLITYDPAKGTEQDMNCVEFTSIPPNHWFDIPSRIMAREGALMIINGGVYDFDYNGIPGVVPFIKKDGQIKAQPQILSYKGEGIFAWTWGQQKKADIIARSRSIPATGIAPYLKNLFHVETANYKNAMGGMTFMTGSKFYDILDLQPDWMRSYPPFPAYYLREGQRCYFAPLSLGCTGTEVVAPIDEGWNNCSLLGNDDDVHRFSALAYRQYPRIFDAVPNARTFVGLKGNQLDIGIIDGDYGQRGFRGRIATKTLGMHNYEVSQFAQSQGYAKFVNLDGGSSTQFWINGIGPQQMLDAYPLRNDNQGPYYSRIISSFLLVVPKLHRDQVQDHVQDCYCAIRLDNDLINWNYSDENDLHKRKAIIDFTPSIDKLNVSDGYQGLIAGRYKVDDKFLNTRGAVLFYLGEDMHYEDTKGLAVVRPRLRNLMVVALGQVLPSLRDSLAGLPLLDASKTDEFRRLINSDKVCFYYVKVYQGKVMEYYFATGQKLWTNSKFESFVIYKSNYFDGIRVMSDNYDLATERTVTQFSPAKQPGLFLDVGEATHCYVGAVNLDGRFLTGNPDMYLNSFLFIAGSNAMSNFNQTELNDLSYSLTDGPLTDGNLPTSWGTKYYNPGVYGLEFGETAGRHVFAIAPNGLNLFYGLRVFCQQTEGQSDHKKANGKNSF